jgi:hypothetical protein
MAGLAPTLRYDFAITNATVWESTRWRRMRHAAGNSRRLSTVATNLDDAIGDGTDPTTASGDGSRPYRAWINDYSAGLDPWQDRIILIGGAKDPEFLQKSSDVLATVLPGASKHVLAGWGHEVLCNEDDIGGSAYRLAGILRSLIPPESFYE